MKILLFVCAFWTFIYFDPSDGASTTRKLGNCPKNGYKTAEFACEKKCIIRSAIVRFRSGGNVNIVGRDGRRLFTPLLCGRKCFCRGFKGGKRNVEKCFKKKNHRITKGIVSFVMKCKKWTRNVRLSVIGNIRPPTKKPTVRKIEKMNADERKYFLGRCSGKCELKAMPYVTFDKGGGITLHLSTSTNPWDINVCDVEKCICKKDFFPGSTLTRCLKKQGVPSNTFTLMMLAEYETFNGVLHLSIANLLSFNPFVPECGCDKANMNGNCDEEGKCFCNSGYTNDQGDNICR